VVHAQPWHQRAIAFLWSLVNAVSFLCGAYLPLRLGSCERHR